ncbi:putative oligopeptide transporter [Methanocella paludicola SANAE]|uniref:Oligopeptide transporter n=1 Tax=Methanocella paludicola (strain DSM 17711 / JCM 13418 / NBRC 101707 / SANAE) TaxID=304371 RepID=D1Z0A5_METPS|nr:OPT/YSL family transporter [Methanocella paludicola]BAI62127.1 putative oligopeptide transporter [Methanocella paludicola SANAE]
MKKQIIVVAAGVLFSMVNAFVSMYMGMKTGFGDGIAILLLFISFIIVTAAGVKSRSKSLICIAAIIVGATGVVLAYTDGLGAIIMSGKPFTVPDYAMMAILVLSGTIGILFSYYFTDYFLKGSFPWPSAKVMASLIDMLTAEKANVSRRVSIIRMGAAGAFSGCIAGLRSFGSLPEVLGSVNLGVGLSPMMAGIGLIIGWRACIQVALGALASLAIFLLFESPGTNYTTHMRNPWIFSTSISMMVMTALITMYIVLKPAAVSFITRLRVRSRAVADGGALYLRRGDAALLVSIACAAILMALFPRVPAWIFIICILVAVLFMVIETRGRAEMGLGVGMSSFVILLVVGLAFDDIVPLVVLEGFVVSTIMTFSLILSIQKQSEFCGVNTKGLATMTLIGVITGSIICVPFMKFFNALFGIGTASLPAPYSIMWLEMANTATSKIISPSINLYLVLLGAVLALIMYRYKMSAVSVALGLMLPVSTCVTIVIGGILAWVIEKKGYLKDDNGITASGLMAGDIIVSIIASLRYL